MNKSLTANAPSFDPHHVPRLEQLKGAPLASFQARTVAFAIDVVVAFVLFLVVLLLGARVLAYLNLFPADKDYNFEFNLEHWYSLLFVVLYFGLSTYFGKGQTLGKRLLGIRVVSLAHEHLSLWHSIERALGYGASALELGFGFLQYFVHPNKQTVHDRIAETVVIKSASTPRSAGH